VDGNGSTWNNNGSLYVNSPAPSTTTATLSITNGGIVIDNLGYIASQGYNNCPEPVVTVSGVGSEWINRSSLYVATSQYSYGANGALNIINGGTVINAVGYVGSDYNSIGTITLSDAGSAWINKGSLYVGYDGTGTVTQTGGTNTVVGFLNLAYDYQSTGTYNLNGGTLALYGLKQGYGQAAFNFGGGTLRASGNFASSVPLSLTGTGGDAHVDTAGLAVTLSGELSGPGGLDKQGAGVLALTGPISYTGTTTIDGGTLLISTPAVTQATVALHKISGKGGLTVGDGTNVTPLSADSISVGTLTLAAGSIVTINPLPGGPAFNNFSQSPGIQAIPEPGIIVFILTAAVPLLYFAPKRRFFSRVRKVP
jgi:T5SS/PEP-CTERM-associated repeat protein/autotransporter-associated beta strand protein